MRRSEKKIVLELLDTISEAHREYKNLRLSGDNEAYVEVLTGCQESAVSIGNAIEQSEGEGTESVRLLEKYCEDLYQASQGSTSIRLDEDLADIRKSIMAEIPVILEVVFFPYKASMWDSMESIYLAFKARKDVHTYLVPIPYYNRKNDGTVESIHCERDLFPSDEEITDWRAYDVEKIKPDIAFIHNPYDDMNYVTTVDPRFYSFELKKNVDCLVYCPYFSTVGIIPKAQSLCKAYIYSDYILAQSEYQADSYDKVIPKRKFLPMGSPKFDKVICLNNERIIKPDQFYSMVPYNWRKQSKGKKVYFYNTSLSGLLKNTLQFLDKMEYVFGVFSGRNDVILLWRPHPLLDDTLKAMRPEFYDRYLEIKKHYIDSGIGILDETSDISISVAYSDAFIGDAGTSVTSLFVVCGKPIFILDDAITRAPIEQDINDYYFQAPFSNNHCGYITTSNNNLFSCKMPFSDAIEYHFVTSLSDYSFPLYGFCYSYKEEIFIAPKYTEDILIYNTETCISRIELKHCTDQRDKFFASFVYNNYMILVPDEYEYFVRLDMATKEVVYSDDLHDIYASENQNFVRSCGGSCLCKNYIYIASTNNNRILQFDVVTMKYRVIIIGNDTDHGFWGMVNLCKDSGDEYSDSLIMLPYRGLKVVRFFPENGEVRNYNITCEGFFCSSQGEENIDEIKPFSSAIYKHGFLFFAPYRGNKCVALNTESGESYEWKFPLSLERKSNDGYLGELYYKGALAEYNKKFYWLSGTEKRLYEISAEKEQCDIIKAIPVKFDSDELREHINGFCQNSPWWTQYGLKEDAVNSLDSFLSGKVYGAPFDRQKELDSFKNVAVNLDGTCGQHVCDFLMKKMELS